MKKSFRLVLTLSSLLLVAVLCVIYVLAQRSRTVTPQPRDKSVTAGNAKEIVVPVGGDLQSAINKAPLGSTIILDAGATYPGPIRLTNKGNGTGSDADYITIRTSNLSGIPAPGERVKPALHGAAMPKIVANQQSAVSTDDQAHHYKFIGVEFAPASNSAYVYNLIDLGRSDATSLDQVPHHLVFDRCFIHSTGLNKARRGIALNSAETSIIDSHVAGFAGAEDETQAIAGWNGPGPFHIVNNYLEGGAEVILFGGADPSIPNLIPSDIEIRRNHLYRPLAWQGKAMIKGNFELKNARRVVVDSNVIDGAIRETAFVLTVRNQGGKAPWSTLEDIEVTNNIVRSAGTGVNILGRDTYNPSGTAKRIRVVNNLFTDILLPGGIAYFVQVNDGEDITIEHNTVQQAGNIISSEIPTTRFVFRNNIVQYNSYGMACFAKGPACSNNMACNCLLAATIKGNVIVDNAGIGNNYPIDGNFPLGNFFAPSLERMGFVDIARGNWRLTATSKYRGRATDGKDSGIDFAKFEASGVEQLVAGPAR